MNYAIDRNALVRLYGGLATPTENILPPTYPQYKKHDLYPYNLAKAKQLIQEAGATGRGRRCGARTARPSKKPVAYLADVLNKIGLKATHARSSTRPIYWTTVGNQATKAQIGFADWFQDYPHPLDWFDVLLNGERITQTHNNNYSNYNNTAVNTKIDALEEGADPDEPRSTPVGCGGRHDHEGRRVGAVREPAVHGLLQQHGRHELLHQPRAVSVRLQPDLHEVGFGR